MNASDKPGTPLVLDLPPDIEQGLSKAAATHGHTAPEHAVELLREALTEEPAKAPLHGAIITEATIAEVVRVREQIMYGRQFSTDSAELLSQIREQRCEPR